MAKWNINLKKWAENKEEEIDTIRRTFVYMLYRNIVLRTPKDTGRAQSNWNVSMNSADTSVTEKKTPNLDFDVVPEAKGDETYYIANNLPYIRKLEYGGYPKDSTTGKTVNGYSRQAPNGMVGVTVADAEAIYEAIIGSVK